MKLSEWLTNSSTSQSEFARRLGVTQGRISQLVGGEQPSLELALKIAGLTANQVRPEDFKEIAMTKTLDTVEEAIKAIANGEMVVVVDDDDRENEGDLIAAAAKITPLCYGQVCPFHQLKGKLPTAIQTPLRRQF